MSEHRFRIHFTVDEANAWLPRLRRDLPRLVELVAELQPEIEALQPVIVRRGNGGGIDVTVYQSKSQRVLDVLEPIQEAGILIKDLQRGLVDFPHLRGGDHEVFLCWQFDDPDRIEWWHEIEDGFAGRTPL